ncbi:MAG: HAMP domain-containing histidine kinase [Tannerellaceae bacterium]|jgi:signal transduction histidine kinase|nr:HAMP domain-containing histidine kinase [Tannerellaceae bacterium]
MPDFDIKDITKLKRRIQDLERVFLVGVILTVAAFYYHQHPGAEIVLTILIGVYIAKKIFEKRLRQQEYLAKIVEERTIELRVQRDQVLMESEKLSAALAALAEAQDELVRNERFSTVGQLTKGLVDRILNPLNYINNFAGLSVELIQDLEKNLRNAAGALSQETYAETLEIAGMINNNLAKIGEHGANTVRIVKAMEELLKDQKGKMLSTDINNLCKVNLDVIAKLFAKEIEEKKVLISFRGLTLSLMIDLNIEQMSKVLLHILKNSMYALLKKAAKETFEPELSLKLEKRDSLIAISIHDNGIGLEDSIKDKIFEPFFTTKPTAEAAGIGLYISREVILNHKGTIKVESEKDQYCEFTITIPIHQNTENNE